MRLSDIVKIPQTGDPVYLPIKVVPRSKRAEYAGTMDDGTHKIRIAAAPERGRANAALLSWLADELSLDKEWELSIISGA
ncbi:MAG TPA: DUF167 domain-containing protein [bacterium]|nr:DUF167 domain-containing protein [bacterium]